MKLSDKIRPDCEAAPWVIAEVKKLEAERDRLADLRTRVAALRNDSGRIDLTNSAVRDEVYSLVRTAEGIGPT